MHILYNSVFLFFVCLVSLCCGKAVFYSLSNGPLWPGGWRNLEAILQRQVFSKIKSTRQLPQPATWARRYLLLISLPRVHTITLKFAFALLNLGTKAKLNPRSYCAGFERYSASTRQLQIRLLFFALLPGKHLTRILSKKIDAAKNNSLSKCRDSILSSLAFFINLPSLTGDFHLLPLLY